MTDGVVNGTVILVYNNGTPIAAATGHQASQSVATRDTVNKDNAGWKTIEAGVREWTFSGNGHFKFDATYGYQDLFAIYLSRTQITVRFGSETDGDLVYEGTAYLTELTADAPSEENTTYTYTFTGDGALTEIAVGVPSVTSMVTYNGNVITITYDEDMASVYGMEDQFSVKINGTPATVTEIANDYDNTMFLTISETMLAGQTLTVSILSGEVRSDSGGLLAAVTDYAVTNILT